MNNPSMTQPGIRDNGIYEMLQQIQQELRQTQLANNSVLIQLTEIESNVSKLTKIENIVENVQIDVNNLKAENQQISSQVKEVETACEGMSAIFDAYVESKEKTENEISKLKSIDRDLEQNVRTMNSNYEKIQSELLELKTRSMQENLLFVGSKRNKVKTPR